jgi:hypothetical protein
MPPGRLRRRLADLVGLGFLLFVLFDYLRPSLLLLPTITAGGDTPCHYPSLVFMARHLLPRLRIEGWYQGAYLGHPLFLYYFPLPFLAMAALGPFLGLPVAFKIGIVLPVFLMPLVAYLSFRLLGFSFPVPLLGAASALVFLFVEENPIWGGTLASTLTGEFCYTWGATVALLFLGVCYRAYTREHRVVVPGLALALVALCHGYCLVWAGLSATFFLYSSRKPLKTLWWLFRVALLAFCLVGPFIVPLIADWRFTTPYDDPWITLSVRNLLPPLLGPLAVFALLGLVHAFTIGKWSGGADRRLLFLLHSTLMGAALAFVAPALGVIDVRLVPLAQLSLTLSGGAFLGIALSRLGRADLAALGTVILLGLFADVESRNLRPWIDWNFQGLEAKELWPRYSELAGLLKGGVSDPRVAVEYSKEHEKAGSIRVYETFPLFSGRSTLEGVYNQASLMTHEVYYLASELDDTSPNPFKSRDYAHFDLDAAFAHLRLLNVSDIVALSTRLVSALENRPDAARTARVPPYQVFHLKDAPSGYVEPLRFQPFRSSPIGFRDKAYFWFTRTPMSPVFVAYTDDPRFPELPDDFLAPPERPLEDDAHVDSRLEDEVLSIDTTHVGHPLLVKISYHPRWRAEGADGPYLVSPALMLIVPRERHVRMVYGRNGWDTLGILLCLAGLVSIGVSPFLPKRRAPQPSQALLALSGCEAPAPPRRWGGLLPGGILLLCLLGLTVLPRSRSAEAAALRDRARAAMGAGRSDAAAEYARAGLFLRPAGAVRLELLCLRGEGLLPRNPLAAALAFTEVTRGTEGNPLLPEALLGAYRAGIASGDLASAGIARERLLREYAGTPPAHELHRELAGTREGLPPQ